MKTKPASSLSLFCLCLCLAAIGTARATDQVLATSKNGTTVTVNDVLAEVRSAPADIRGRILQSPKNISQIVSNLVIARSLAHEATKHGLDKESDMRWQLQLLRDRALADAWVKKAEGTPPNETELDKAARAEFKAYPERYATPVQVHVRHILIAKQREGAQKTALEVLAKLKGGADFATLAQEYSDDPGTKSKGGDMGFIGTGKTVEPFEKAAFALKNTGDLSDVVETRFGFHVLRLEERNGGKPLTYDESKDAIEKNILAKLLRDRRNKVVEAVEQGVKYDEAAIAAFTSQQKQK